MEKTAPPTYDIQEFIQSCKEGVIYIWDPALHSASDFNIFTGDKLMEFIANDGLENLCFDRCRPLELWKPPPPSPMVDSYSFSSGSLKGYLAFFKSPVTGLWNLKSFKINLRLSGLNFPFKNLGNILSGLKMESENKNMEESDE